MFRGPLAAKRAHVNTTKAEPEGVKATMCVRERQPLCSAWNALKTGSQNAVACPPHERCTQAATPRGARATIS
jgi:hypothetical protein